jgi:hypothetical protein
MMSVKPARISRIWGVAVASYLILSTYPCGYVQAWPTDLLENSLDSNKFTTYVPGRCKLGVLHDSHQLDSYANVWTGTNSRAKRSYYFLENCHNAAGRVMFWFPKHRRDVELYKWVIDPK